MKVLKIVLLVVFICLGCVLSDCGEMGIEKYFRQGYESPFNLQNLYFGINVILLAIAAYCTNRFDLLNKLLDHSMLSGKFEWWNLLFFKKVNNRKTT
ncbi:hypothetical protein CMK18_17025 [Candidatus Poribacteria bacterium]|nr:hypothetical protein [Candidatus Poribacteria bacterium]